MNHRYLLLAAFACVLVFGNAVGAAPVAAQEAADTGPSEEEEETDDDGGDTIVNLDEVVDAIEDFTGSWDATLKEVIIAVLFKPFLTLYQQLLEILAKVLTTTPSVYPNPSVEEVHRQVLMVTYLISGLAFTGVGLLYIIGPVIGVSYQQVRMILPRLVLALVFGSISLPLLQYLVEFTNVLTLAFAPNQLSMNINQYRGIVSAGVLGWVINASQLLMLVVIFIMRDVYILFAAAISPLLALAWAFPQTKRYADTFIAGWFTALAMAPLDMLVLKFALALLDGGTGLQYVSNWILGVASFTLLIIVPYQLYGASQAAVGQAYSIAGGVKTRYRQHRKRKRHRELMESNQMNQNRRRNRVRSDGGKFEEARESIRKGETPDEELPFDVDEVVGEAYEKEFPDQYSGNREDEEDDDDDIIYSGGEDR